MTDEQKIALIKREPKTLWEDFTAEEKEFLNAAFSNPHDMELYRKVWEEKPGNLEHALKNAPCTPADLETTAKTLHAIWEYWEANGGSRGDLEETTVKDTLELIDRRLAQCKL